MRFNYFAAVLLCVMLSVSSAYASGRSGAPVSSTNSITYSCSSAPHKYRLILDWNTEQYLSVYKNGIKILAVQGGALESYYEGSQVHFVTKDSSKVLDISFDAQEFGSEAYPLATLKITGLYDDLLSEVVNFSCWLN